MSRINPEPPDSAAEHLHVVTKSRASRTRDLATAALIVSLLAISAWVAIPLGTVPVTLQVFVVVLAALLLTPPWAAAALSVYVLMGAAGLPVFSQGTGGLGVIFGPTGGYILGFFIAAPAGAAIRIALRRRRVSVLVADACAAAACIVCIYLLGWAQLAAATNMAPAPAFLVGVLPFLIPDAIKAAVAVGVVVPIRRARAAFQA